MVRIDRTAIQRNIPCIDGNRDETTPPRPPLRFTMNPGLSLARLRPRSRVWIAGEFLSRHFEHPFRFAFPAITA
jgi:hypothetical protein